MKNKNKTTTKKRVIQKEHCDICGNEISKQMYRKNAGFCKSCYKLYFES